MVQKINLLYRFKHNQPREAENFYEIIVRNN